MIVCNLAWSLYARRDGTVAGKLGDDLSRGKWGSIARHAGLRE